MKKILSILLLASLFACHAVGAKYSRVSVHDPSIVIAYEKGGKVTGEKSDGATKRYYIFGSHKAWAKSSDMMNWKRFSNNIPSQQNTLFKNEIQWSKLGGTSYSVDGNLWAPDVIWNKAMQKWCMYMSVNGDNWYSSIVLLTADSPEGNWSYVGPVVYSIPWKAAAADVEKYTDFYRVLGLSSGAAIPSRYKSNRNGNQIYGMNAIDPCVFYDEDGTLWMTYGSWFGGLYMLQLDPNTGLRDYTRTYELKGGTATTAESDPYQGIKIYGGNHTSGEASYIEYINDRYYLFVTYGGLTANGGYNMRVFSSKTPTGPYKDLSGEAARFSSTSQINSNSCCGTVNGYAGTRLMSYYKWSWMPLAFCAQGHNSVVVDDDGKIFNVYHTRFNSGNEGHEVRVHQMFQAKNGGLCSSPFEYCGETLGATAYTEEDLVGFYSILDHGYGTSYSTLAYVSEKEIELKENGTVAGAATGSWSISEGKYLTLKFGTETYQGVVIEQFAEERDNKVLCITGVSNKDRSLWGFKKFAKGQNFEGITEYKDFTVGATNNSSAFFTAKSPVLSMDGDGVVEARFTNYTAGANNWENWLFVCTTNTDNGAAYSEYIVQRADYWWWATDKSGSNENCTANYDWSTFRTDMNNATVLFTCTRKDNTVYTDYDITTSKGKKLWYKFNRTTTYDNSLSFFFTNEKSHQTFDYFRLKNSNDGIGSIIYSPAHRSNKTYNLAGQSVGKDYRGIVIKNGKKYLQ